MQARVGVRTSQRRVAALVIGAGPALAVDETKDAAANAVNDAFESRSKTRRFAHDL